MYQLLDQTAANVLQLLNEQGKDIVKGRSLHSTRAIGDAVQDFLGDKLPQCIPAESLGRFENGFERRSMEDMAFFDTDNRYYAVDCKTHNQNTAFNMPNLISVRRLANFYRNETNVFCILIVKYEVVDGRIEYHSCHLKTIEAFAWNCLTIGALGWGQIRIANSNNIIFNKSVDRKSWMLELCQNIETFYDEEIGKISERKLWFKEIKEYWENV